MLLVTASEGLELAEKKGNDEGLVVSGLGKVYESGPHSVEVLKSISFSLSNKERLVVTGPSGSGKSTLLHLLGTLDQPTSGEVRLNGVVPSQLDEADLARFRNEVVGFIFQDHFLLPQYTILENVILPSLAIPSEATDVAARGKMLLDAVGLAHRLDHLPAEISGGERQRVAVARALINRPTLLLCDEPTGSLDQVNAAGVTDLLFKLQNELGAMLIVVTHSLALANRFERRLDLVEGTNPNS